MLHLRRLLLLLALLTCTASVHAEVLRVEIDARDLVLNGKTFGGYGSYELIRGRILFGFDPAHPMNRRIVDLTRAPRNADGLVEAWADLIVLQPENPAQGRRMALVEVCNRGRRFSLSYFNRATSNTLDPDDPEAWGDDLLMRLGLTVIWVGWQFDVPLDDDLLRLHVPRVQALDGAALTGLVRSDWTVDEAATELSVSHNNHLPYRLAGPDHPDNVLTVRDGRDAPRTVVPRDQWQFVLPEPDTAFGAPLHIRMASGFEVGRIYELVYRARDPAIVGLGLAAVRDVISYAKYHADSRFPVRYGLAVGVSQTGRFLRHFLYEGFNTDEQGRMAYDGMLILGAGAGRGSFNHRFAQPSRDGHPYAAFFYPTDLFPFTSTLQHDPEWGRSDGLLAHLDHPDHAPKTIYVNTGYEYWGRAASLIHTTPDGVSDALLPPNERIYHLAGAQHSAWSFPPDDRKGPDEAPVYRGNPLDVSASRRALLVHLADWVDENKTPPPSAYPRRDEETLVPITEVAFPRLPGLPFPEDIHVAYRADYGPRWSEGIIDFQPPRLGNPFPSLVSQVDSLGNERAGIRNIELLVPLATYTPWHIREGLPGGNGRLTSFFGTYSPLPRTAAEKAARNDPRPSLDTLYPDRKAYLTRVWNATQMLIDQGFLLSEDRSYVIGRATDYWNWIFEE